MLVLDEKYLRLDGKVQFVYISEKKMIFSTRNHMYTIIGTALRIKEYSISETLLYGSVTHIEVEYV
ncbi:MAG: hypothetical protein IJ359_08485 [Erysipelotrichaceae bacterium]|nr:hypothetical protein [Erysipelotrichaceae bacterium]